MFPPQQPPPPEPVPVAIHARLRNQILKRRIDVGLPLLLCLLTIRIIPIVVLSAGLAVSAHVDSECVYSGIRQLPGNIVPRFACSIALMKEQHAWATLLGGEEGGFQGGAVGRLNIDNTRRRAIRRRDENAHVY